MDRKSSSSFWIILAFFVMLVLLVIFWSDVAEFVRPFLGEMGGGSFTAPQPVIIQP